MIICANFVLNLILRTEVLQCLGVNSGLIYAAISVSVISPGNYSATSQFFPTLPQSCLATPLIHSDIWKHINLDGWVAVMQLMPKLESE